MDQLRAFESLSPIFSQWYQSVTWGGSEMMTNHKVCPDITGSCGMEPSPITAAPLWEAGAQLLPWLLRRINTARGQTAGYWSGAVWRRRRKRRRWREGGKKEASHQFFNLPRGKMHNHIISHTTWFKGGQNKFVRFPWVCQSVEGAAGESLGCTEYETIMIIPLKHSEAIWQPSLGRRKKHTPVKWCCEISSHCHDAVVHISPLFND